MKAVLSLVILLLIVVLMLIDKIPATTLATVLIIPLVWPF